MSSVPILGLVTFIAVVIHQYICAAVVARGESHPLNVRRNSRECGIVSGMASFHALEQDTSIDREALRLSHHR